MTCVIVVLIGVAGAINCYDCDSWVDDSCGDAVDIKYLKPCKTGYCMSGRTTIDGITGQSATAILYLISSHHLSHFLYCHPFLVLPLLCQCISSVSGRERRRVLGERVREGRTVLEEGVREGRTVLEEGAREREREGVMGE